jgi:SAM-dependent methyltransferase
LAEVFSVVAVRENLQGGSSMSRKAAMLRMNYFPLPEAEARRIRGHLAYPASLFTALDPCAGDGKALALITEAGQGQRCGIELDADRAEAARRRLDQVVYADCFDVECRAASVGLLYINPPYSHVVGDEGRGQRLEALFLQRTHRWLKPGGVLILVISSAQLAICGNLLSTQFKDTELYRLSEPESVRYKQIVVFGVRRSRRERDRLQEREISTLRLDYGRKARTADSLPVLTDRPACVYAVPQADPIELIHRGLPLDEIEDCVAQSPAYRQARRILFAVESRECGRPLTPLTAGHVALLAVSSMLDGIFGAGSLRHLSRWQATKLIRESQEEDENGVVTVRQREEFSHSLNLLYADGNTAVLTSDPPLKEQSSEERLGTDAAHGEVLASEHNVG